MNITNYIKWDVHRKCIRKILLLMRLTTVIILATVFQLSAAITFGQKLTYNKKNITIRKLFREIKNQTGFSIAWSDGKLSPQMEVDANFYNTPLTEVMERILRGRSVTYKIVGKMIIVKPAEKSLFDEIIAAFKTIDVQGRVFDENNEPLVGAVVKVKGGKQATSTNSKGEFLLKNVDEKAILVISFLGYNQQEIKATEKMGDIKLVMSEDNLQEVQINAGYYTVTDRERTGSISRITSKDIERQPVNNILQAMQANIPGVQIIQATGVPGSGFTVQVRGQNSISNRNEPFYIIDGVPFTSSTIAGARSAAITLNASPLAGLNPADIESIEVLKDADATAIYGSRGANGVILISTKKGKSGKGNAFFSINQGISKVGRKLGLMNTEQYLEMREEALTNDKLAISTTDYDLNGTWDKNKYTDWQKELIGGTAPTTNILASLSGGVNNITYLIGGNYYKEGTVFPGESSYGRNSGNFSLQYTSENKKLNASFNTNYSQINSDLFTTDLTQFITLAPNYPSLLDEKGNLNWSNNTMYVNPISNTLKSYNAKTNTLISNALLTYSIIQDLKIKASFGYTLMDRKEFGGDPLTTFSPVFNYGPERRRSNFANNSTSSWILETQVDWNKKIGNGKLNMLFGTTFQQNLTDGQEISGSGYTSDALLGNIAAASVLTISNRSYLQYRYNAIFGRLNYNLDNRYLVNLTGRIDGSSRFGKDNQFANFGAVGVAWIISEENFMKNKLPFISFAKLRGSYGITGNDAIPDYGYLELWNASNTYQGVSTLAPSRIANPNYAWEVNKKAEVAFELSFFKDKLNLSVEYYRNRSSNQLVQRSLTPSTGFSFITDNLPAVIGNTGWEFELGGRKKLNKSFSWNGSINLSIPRNELISYPGLATSNNASIYEIGHPLSIKKLYNTTVDPQTGLFIREDFDKNGIINAKDQYIIAFLGRKYYGGLQNSISYKGIELNFTFQFVKQFGSGYLTGFGTPGAFNRTSPVNNEFATSPERWRNPGDIVDFQKYSTIAAGNTAFGLARQFGSLANEDNSFIRLKNVALTYTFPIEFAHKLSLNSAKFFIQGQNIVTITSYKGLDPETQSLSKLPLLQTFAAGLQISL